MNRRNTFQTRIFLLLLLLALPALACATLTGGADDGEPAGSVVESEQDAASDEQDSLSDSGAEDGAGADDDAGAGAETDEGDPASEGAAESQEAAGDSRETIVSALRTGLDIDRMRMHITSEAIGTGQVTDVMLAFVRPDRYHLVSEGLEVIVVEDTTYLKGPDDKWTTVPGTEMLSTVEGSLAAFAGEAAIEERLDSLSRSDVIYEGRETINGVETQVYSFNEGLDTSSIFGRVKMWIGIEDGLLYRQEVESEISGIGSQATMEFEYGDAVTVEPPEL
jgi:hypothetical protein